MVSGPYINWANSPRILERCARIVDRINKLALERDHTVIMEKREGTESVDALHITCNVCNSKWSTKKSTYYHVKNGCHTCSHLSQKGLTKILDKNVSKVPFNIDGLTAIQMITDAGAFTKESFQAQKYNQDGSLKPLWYKNINKQNAYHRYIDLCRQQNLLTNSLKGHKLQNHHIIQQYWFLDDQSPEALEFMNSKENLIKLTQHQHITSHIISLGIYQNGYDKAAISALTGDVVDSQRQARLLGGQTGRDTMKEKGLHFHDPEMQRTFNLKKHNNKIFMKMQDGFNSY